MGFIRGAAVTVLAIVLVIVVLMGSIVIGSKQTSEKNRANTPKPAEQSTIKQNADEIAFFYGNTCPHCADVEVWMKENKINVKLSIIKTEVYDNMANSIELTKVAEGCGLPTDSIRVPFLSTRVLFANT